MRRRATDRLTAGDLIDLNLLVARLETSSPGRMLGQSTDEGPGVLDDVQSVLEFLEDLDFVDAHTWAQENISSFQERFARVLKTDPAVRLGDDDAKELRNAARDLMEKLREESNKRTVFVVPYDKENYAEQLLRDPRPAFGVKPEQAWLPADAVVDMQEAATCYGVGRYAATILFAVRATESCLRGFFGQVVFLEAPEVRWGGLTATVKLPESKSEAARLAQNRLKSVLGDLRVRRNAAMHAGKREAMEWDAKAARDIISKCSEAIGFMDECLREHRSSEPGRLPVVGD